MPVVDRATCSIPGRRFKSVDDMCAAIAVVAGSRVLFRSVLLTGAVPCGVSLIWAVIVLLPPVMSDGYRQAVCGTTPLWQQLAVDIAFPSRAHRFQPLRTHLPRFDFMRIF